MTRRSPWLIVFLALAAGGSLVPRLLPATAPPASAQAAPKSPGALLEVNEPFAALLAGLVGLEPGDKDAEAIYRKVKGDFQSVKFVIATVPDPIDSFAGWQFDQIVDTLQEAAAATGYLFNRFYMPDIDEHGASGSAASKSEKTAKIHDHQPGIILFRHDDPPSGQTPDVHHLLVIFLVSETPTAGVHERALATAIRAVVGWEQSAGAAKPAEGGVTSPVLILGPTFSGSSESIAHALRDQAPAIGDHHVRVISGSATNDSNKDIIEKSLPGKVTFKATVQPNSAMTRAMAQYLTTVDPKVRRRSGATSMFAPDPHQAVSLIESNTSFGAALAEDAEIPPDPCNPTLNSIVMRFPLHVSRLRAEARAATAPAPTPGGLGVEPRFRPLTLGDTGVATDQLPVLAPQTTASYVELMLSDIMQTIAREDIGIVEINASDTRDKLFLARQLARDAPNALVTTTDADMLFVHPDYYTSMVGTVVASPYPLFSPNQVWTGAGARSRRTFPTSQTEGVYNAFVALVSFSADGARLLIVDPGGSVHKAAGELLEYRLPGGVSIAPHGCDLLEAAPGPPVWISVIGHDTAWPVDVRLPLAEKGKDPYVFAAGGDQATPVAVTSALLPATWMFLLVLMLALAIGYFYVAGSTIRSANGRPAPSWAARLVGRCPGRPLRYVVTCGCSLMLLAMLFYSVATAGLSVDEAHGWGMLTRVVAGAPALVLLVAVVMAARCADLHLFSLTRIALLVLYGAAIAIIASFVPLAIYLADQSRVPWLFVERTTNVLSGVSPAVPIAAFALTGVLWSAIELLRLSRLSHASVHETGAAESRAVGRPVLAVHDPRVRHTAHLTNEPELKYLRALVPLHAHSLDKRMAAFRRALLVVPSRAGALVAVVVAAFFWLVCNPVMHPLVTIDGQWFGRFASIWIVLLHAMLITVLAQCLALWQNMSWLLKRLAVQPTAQAFQRVPAALLPRSLMPTTPSLLDLEVSVAHAAACPSLEVADLRAAFESDLAQRPRPAWCDSYTWVFLLADATASAEKLNKEYERLALTHGEKSADTLQLEQFVVTPAAFIMRSMMVRLWDNVLFVVGALLLLLFSETAYPFQIKNRLAGFVWAEIAVAMVLVFYIFISLEQDDVVSHIQSTKAGKISWDTGFISKVIVYGIVPLLGLLASQFPGVASTLFQWIEPVQRALP